MRTRLLTLLVSLMVGTVASPRPAVASFIRSDANADGVVDFADAVVALHVLFLAAGGFSCADAADANDDGETNILDVVLTLFHLVEGAANPAPGPSVCGEDPTADALSCDSAPACEATVECRVPVTAPWDVSDTGACLYEPASTYAPNKLGLFYLFPPNRDAAGFPVTIWLPDGASEPLPVVLWSHGGGGRRDPGESGPEWSRAFATAGYAVIAMHHMARSTTDMELNVCDRLFGIDAADCPRTTFVDVYETTDKVLDARSVLDSMVELGNLAGVEFDEDRVAVAGHSGGTGAPLFFAGCERNVLPLSDPRELFFHSPDSRPRAFIAVSPPGAEDAGWTNESLARIGRPFFTATGLGDLTPEWRVQPHDAFDSGDKYRLYINDLEAGHSVFNLRHDAGGDPVRIEREEGFHAWLVAATTAFLDAHLLGCDNALAWLESGDLATAVEADVPVGGLAPAWDVR